MFEKDAPPKAHSRLLPVEARRIPEYGYQFGVTQVACSSRQNLLLAVAEDKGVLSRTHSKV